MEFGKIYSSLNGPTEELFDMTKKYSPYRHSFLMVHPDTVICTRQRIGCGFLVYLGCTKEWEECPYDNTAFLYYRTFEDGKGIFYRQKVLISKAILRILVPGNIAHS